MTKCIEKQVGIMAAVKPESHFVKVGCKVLRANLVPCSHDSSLQERKGAFDCVGVNGAIRHADVFIAPMIDGLMVSEQQRQDVEVRSAVGEDARFAGDVLAENRNKRFDMEAICNHADGASALAINQRQHAILVRRAELGLRSERIAPNVGFVDFDSATAATHGREAFATHRFADAVSHEPRGLVGHA